MILALTISTVWATEPAVDPDARAKALARTGAIELSGGIAALSSGVVVMLVGRGEPGEISKESQRTSDLRSAGGAALIIGGFTTALIGGNTLGRARSLRVGLGPVSDRSTVGLRIGGAL